MLRQGSRSIRYLVALAAVAAAIGLRLVLDPWLGGLPYITIFGAIIVAAWFGGVGPALAAAAAGYAGAQFLFVQRFSVIELAAYALSAILIAALGDARRLAGLRAQAAERRFRQFMEHAPAAVFLKDEAGRYAYLNAAAQKLIGAADWRGRTDAELLPPEAAQQIREHDRQVLEADAPRNFSLSVAGPQGPREFFSTKFPLRDAAGERFVGSVTLDVTEQQRAAEALRRQREELRLVTDTLSVGMLRASRDLKFIWVNRVYAAWAGKSPEELAGRPLAEAVGEEGIRFLRPHLERVLAGERARYERLARFARLGQRWVYAVVEPTRDEHGEVDGLVALVVDIHERKEAAEALEAAREQLQLVADSMPAAVTLCTRDLRVAWVNRRAADWLGTVPEAVTGRALADVIGKENLQAMRPHLERVLAGEQVEYERLGRYPGLGERWLHTRLSPTHDGQGWMAVVSDIHERRKTEQRLRDAERRKDELLAALAHELRNPLAPIRNAVAILGRKGALDPELGWSREVIDRQVDQLARVIDDLLDIAHLASGKLAIRKERVALEPAIDRALEASRSPINARGQRLSVLLPSEAVSIEADPARLSQVLATLLANAAAHTANGGGIALSAEAREDEVRVTVQADGGQEPTEAGSAAVRLSLVQGIVALHGGTFETRSAQGTAREYIVRLPRLAEDADAPGATNAGALQPAGGARVLVADDNRDAADSLQRILALYGYEVRVAYDGTAAMRLGEDFKPAVAVLDIGMPGASGYEVARHLRRRCGNGVKLIALTGWGQEADRRRAIDAGFDYHLTKPVDPGALGELLTGLAPK